MKKRAFLFAWLIPLLAVGAIAPFTSPLDLAISRYFFTPATFTDPGHFVSNACTDFLFLYGERLGFIVAGIACAFFLISWVLTFFDIRFLPQYRKVAVVIALTWVVGCGLLVNSLFKTYWGRPRPRQTVEFGGQYAYRPFYHPQLKPADSLKSFPSGHAATGFFYFSLALPLLYLGKRFWFWLFFLSTFLFGTLMSLCRMAQGGHFFSDTLFSALIMWLVALFTTHIIFSCSKSV